MSIRDRLVDSGLRARLSDAQEEARRRSIDQEILEAKQRVSLTAADQPTHTSGMIALVPEHPVAIEGGEPAEESHLTLWFLGPVVDMPDDLQGELARQVEAAATQTAPIEANAFGVAVWNPFGEDPCVVLNVGGPGLREARNAFGLALANAAASMGGAWQVPQQHQPWAAHLCLVYDDNPSEFVQAGIEQLGPVAFDRVRVAYGDEVYDFDLGG